MNVAVVGAGIHGACSAMALARRGHAVTVFDRHPVDRNDPKPNVWGSSHGRSRIIRKAYPDSFYTSIMQEAYALWDELQMLAGGPQFVFHDGLIYYGSESSESLNAVLASLNSNGVPLDILRSKIDHAPGLELGKDEFAVWTPEAGWVHADLAVSAALRVAIAHGAQIVRRSVESWQELERDFDAVVLAPGAWITDFVDVDVTVRVQTVAYIDAPITGPAWIEDGPNFLYGFPVAPGERGAKVGVHTRGHDWHVNDPRPGPDESSLELIKDWAYRRYGVVDAPILEAITCLYTNTSDEDFRAGRLSERSVFVSACSGHGFKFGPWVGEKVANWVEGREGLDAIPRFTWPR